MNFKIIKRIIRHLYLRLGYKIVQITQNQDLQKAYKFRYKIYCLENKFLDPKDFPQESESDIYDKYSTHFAAIDKKGNIVGLTRLINGSLVPLPTEKEFSLEESVNNIRNNGVVEVSRVMIDQKYRKTFLFFDLMRAAYLYSHKHNIKYWAGSIEEGLYKFLSKTFGELPIMGKPKFIYNTWNYPFLVELDKLDQSFKEKNKFLYFLFNKRNL